MPAAPLPSGLSTPSMESVASGMFESYPTHQEHSNCTANNRISHVNYAPTNYAMANCVTTTDVSQVSYASSYRAPQVNYTSTSCAPITNLSQVRVPEICYATNGNGARIVYPGYTSTMSSRNNTMYYPDYYYYPTESNSLNVNYDSYPVRNSTANDNTYGTNYPLPAEAPYFDPSRKSFKTRDAIALNYSNEQT
jgi:hypothetical protein